MTRSEQVFENSPKETRADVRHEIIPEIRVASRILKQPETVDKLREVSQRIKREDEKIKGKHPLLKSPVMTPTSVCERYVHIDDSVFKDQLDTRPLAPFSHNIFRLTQSDGSGLKRKNELLVEYGTSSPLQQRIRRQFDKEPLMTYPERVTDETYISPRPQTWGQWFRKLLCC